MPSHHAHNCLYYLPVSKRLSSCASLDPRAHGGLVSCVRGSPKTTPEAWAEWLHPGQGDDDVDCRRQVARKGPRERGSSAEGDDDVAPTFETAARINVNEVRTWIANIDDATLDEVLAALQTRHDALHAARAANATVGRQVVIRDVQPRHLDGLEGTIHAREGEFVAVLLTAASTGRLRFCKQSGYAVGPDMNFLLEGVPASCCHETDRYDNIPAASA